MAGVATHKYPINLLHFTHSDAESGAFRRFPDEDQVAPENYDYFINELNFNAIDGSVLIGAA